MRLRTATTAATGGPARPCHVVTSGPRPGVAPRVSRECNVT